MSLSETWRSKAVPIAYSLFSQRNKNRQLPKRGQVERLVELSFVGRAVAKEASGDTRLAFHLVGQGKANGDRQATTDDGVPAVESPLRRKQMHRTATATRATVGLPVHLGHDLSSGNAANQGMAVLPIGRHDVVVLTQRVQSPHRDGLFADVKVQEPADLLLRIELRALLLEPSNANHVAQQARGPRHVRCRASIALLLPGSTCPLRASRAPAP